jgi:hypothetical protein
LDHRLKINTALNPEFLRKNTADGREKKKKKENNGGGTRNLLSLPGENEDNDGWGDGINEGAMAELILGVSHDQSRFAPGSTTILTLVDRPLLDADGEG